MRELIFSRTQPLLLLKMFSKRQAFASVLTCYLIISVAFDYVESGCESYNPMREDATSDYLKLENELWKRLSNSVNSDKDSLFQLVRDTHKDFMGGFGYVSTSDALFKLPTTKPLKNALNDLWNLRIRTNFDPQTSYNTIDSITRSYETISNAAHNLSEIITREMIDPKFWTGGTNFIKQCEEEDYDASKVSPYSTTIEAAHQKILDYYHEGHGGLLHTYIFTRIYQMYKLINEKEQGANIRQPMIALVATNQFRDRIRSIHQVASEALKSSSREIWNCRRNKYSSGCVSCSRFEALMNFLQGYIDNEINFNANATCASSCADYELTKHFSCADGTICANPNPGRDPNGLEKDDTICDGIIRECRDIGIEGDITVNFVKFTAGRYNYLYFNDGHRNRTYGLDPKYVRGINLTATTWYNDSDECSLCSCLCDSQTESDRHFSLHDVVSNIAANNVVIGVVLFVRNGVVQWQITEGKLSSRGQADYGESTTSKYEFQRWEHKPVEGVDYFTMSYENRSINLDDVAVPSGHVVTGVRFGHRNGQILIEVRATEFDYHEARLKNIEKSFWVSNSDSGRYEFQLPNRLNPFEKHNQGKIYVPQHLKDSFVRFTPTDFENDLSQMMVPVIETDFMGTRSDCPTALRGIGLTYVNDEELTTAGAIIPKLIVPDFPIPTIDWL